MTNYADYAYYTDTYKGAVIDTASFDLYAMKATQKIKLHTFGRILETDIPDEAKMCCCELAEYLFRIDPSNDKSPDGVLSEKVGEHSISYESGKTIEEVRQTIMKGIIYNWLAMTGLLYRGCN